ncbi:hypothetical protein [Agrobacterium tumefaciens]|nr:hypothetical protein [Agrobacterium tumefaciens]
MTGEIACGKDIRTQAGIVVAHGSYGKLTIATPPQGLLFICD